MIFRKTFKAGTLLYALLMLGVFAMLLQFYIQSQLAAGHASQARRAETQAYFMAQMTQEEFVTANSQSLREKEGDKEKREAAPPSGQVRFTRGQTSYEKMTDRLQVTVRLDSGQTYRYQFPISSEN